MAFDGVDLWTEQPLRATGAKAVWITLARGIRIAQGDNDQMSSLDYLFRQPHRAVLPRLLARHHR
jgi:hypothetical protein